MADGGERGRSIASARAVRVGWTVLAAAPGLACVLAGGRGAGLAFAATALLAGAAAGAPDLATRLGRRRVHAAPPAPQDASIADAPSSGVLTRDAFVRRVEDDVAGGRVGCGVLGVFHFADVDRLATFDSAAADRALRAFEVRLRGAVDASCPVARLRHGGFAAWLPLGGEGAGAADGGEARLQAIAYVLSQPFGADGPALTPTVSTAAAAYPQDGRDAAELLRCADALLAAGGAAGGEVATVSSQTTAAARDRFSLIQELRGAMARDELHLQFQPVVDAVAGRVAGAEALLRWTSAGRGAVPPAAFIPLLEEGGLIDEVGLWILNAACRQLGAWSGGPLAAVKVAVNVSARQFRDPQLPKLIARTLELHRVAPERLEVELTETAAMEDEARTRRLLVELHELGVSVAIDDFGSGWSSISYLKNLPFSKLKIDREFVTELDLRPDSRAICRSMIELGRGLGMTVLAEGMERREEVDVLRAMGCRLFQGYWFSRPLDAPAFEAKVRDPSWLAALQPPPPAASPLRVVGA